MKACTPRPPSACSSASRRAASLGSAAAGCSGGAATAAGAAAAEGVAMAAAWSLLLLLLLLLGDAAALGAWDCSTGRACWLAGEKREQGRHPPPPTAATAPEAPATTIRRCGVHTLQAGDRMPWRLRTLERANAHTLRLPSKSLGSPAIRWGASGWNHNDDGSTEIEIGATQGLLIRQEPFFFRFCMGSPLSRLCKHISSICHSCRTHLH